MNIRQIGQLFEILFPRVVQVVGIAAAGRRLGDLVIEAGDAGQQLICGGDIIVQGGIEGPVQAGEALRGLVEAVSQALGLVNQGLALGGRGGIRGHALEGIEEAVQLVRQAGGGGRTGRAAGAVRARGTQVQELAQFGLGILQSALLARPVAADAGFVTHFTVEDGIPQLLDSCDLHAGAFGSDRRGSGDAGADLDALPGVGGVVDVGEVLAGDFQAGFLRLEGTRAKIQGVE